jgi:hypothetical protein
MGKQRTMNSEWTYRRTSEPSLRFHSPARSSAHSSVEPIRLLLLCFAAGLMSSTSVQGAEPNTSGAPASVAAAAKAKSGKTPVPSPKTRTGPAPQDAVAAATVPAAPAQVPQIVTHLPQEPDSNSILTDRMRSRLWQSRILPPDPNEDANTKAALHDLIQRLKTAGAERPVNEPAPRKPIVIEPSSTAPKNSDAAVAVKAPVEQPNLPVAKASAEPNAALSPAALDRLDHLMKDPNLVHDPLELAELLFLNNRPAEAAVLYEKALMLTVPNDPASSDDRAWILFQLGTCLRQTNMAKARDTYLKLISEFPNSPWTELAKANGRLINWYESAKPQQLIASPTRE